MSKPSSDAWGLRSARPSFAPKPPVGPALAALALAAVAAAPALIGCGAAAYQEPASPEAAPDAAPMRLTTERDAQHELDRAEAELASALGGGAAPRFASPPYGAGAAAEPGATAPPAPPPQPMQPAPPAESPAGKKEAEAKAAGDAQATQVSASPCMTACRALASMTRAAEHLCGLAGEGDDRCAGARARVKSATDRVESQCPSCAR